nr:transposase family protein [Kineosporia mesophila]
MIWASPALPGARHDAGAVRKHAIPATWAAADVTTFADAAHIGAGSAIRAPFRRLRRDPASHLFTRRELSAGQKAVNTSISQMRAPGERADAELKSWRLLRKIRSSPAHTACLVNAVRILIRNS